MFWLENPGTLFAPIQSIYCTDTSMKSEFDYWSFDKIEHIISNNSMSLFY